ncbi:lytic transglycosylase domain-containing protein [Marinilabilia salmonicolor]|uniref:lytic transglycosylase domain-containing protein n=1 Tax=Marinilabilia salmonicolor TaxID=989 RepID=UPI00029A63D8|nr:lytic transglycosylase domain-containing protein [Marinilabilia salmonicolor]
MIRKLLVAVFVLFVIIGQGHSQTDKAEVHVPEYLVGSRIEKLNLQTPVSLTYNEHVQAYIDVYTLKRPDHLAGILARSEMYFPLFEEYLDKYDLPLELKYLAVIESALDPRAKSSSGAYGLWQFLFQASRMFDLEVNSYVDERADPVKATDAACRYLKYLHANFNDWLLAIAAYNGGIGAVKEAIAKAGGEKDYWKLRPYLSDQVRGYVPAFVAVNYVMNHYEGYGIEKKSVEFRYEDLLTTSVNGGISFEQITTHTQIPIDILRLLNPVYKMDYIPVQPEPVRIVLPEDKFDVFHEKLPFFEVETKPVANRNPAPGDTVGRTKDSHIVAPGQFFHEIAMMYQCRIEDLLAWNGLDNKFLHAGQRLVVWKPAEENSDRVSVSKIEQSVDVNYYNAGSEDIKTGS